jgi:uncharacterized protein YbaP (TraB family)
MKLFRLKYLLPLLAFGCATAQKNTHTKPQPLEKSLLWEISGNGLAKPSYLYGTIHMLCKDDAVLSDSLAVAIEKTDKVYLEVDIDNMFEMLGAFSKMKMKGDTTLADLLSKEDYNKVKKYMESSNSLLPFSVLETYKPMLVSSLMMESGIGCEEPVAMEQLIMADAKQKGKKVDGLETMAYQLSIFDSIPYKVQAEELLKYVKDGGKSSEADKEFEEMMEAYKNQDLDKLSNLIGKSESNISDYEDLLLNNRNRNWVYKLKTIMKDKPVTVAVGAGHLPGEKGVISLLRKEGYSLRPVKNKITGQRVI